MKNTTIEPPGSRIARPASKVSPVISLRSPALKRELPHQRIYPSVEGMVRELRPQAPVYCLRPATISAAAKQFIRSFPGDVMYAVKCNPEPRVLHWLHKAGVMRFDVASLPEIRLVAQHLPKAKLYYMHPVKSRAAIAEAYDRYGVRDFSLDSHDELQKILAATGHASDLNLYVRVAMRNDSAAYSLSGKYGVPISQATGLLTEARRHSRKLGVCFHVGSQCMNPEAYVSAIASAMHLVDTAGVKLDVLDIGGGFPSVYPGMTPPPLGRYMQAIRSALTEWEAQLKGVQVICEPGRALVAEGGSTVARVDARRGNMLYLNEGVYGSLFDAGTPGFVFPVKAMRPDSAQIGALSDEMAEFGFFGPTCDSVDAMKGPFMLPANIDEGDWIEIGQLGSYGITMRTNFNGFYSDAMVEVADAPLLSMLDMN